MSGLSKLLVAALVLSWAAGCARFNAIEECQQVVGLMNPALDEIERISEDGPQSPERLLTISRAYAKLSVGLAALGVTNPKVSTETKTMSTFMKKVADNTKAYARAMEAQQRRRLSVARHTATKQVSRQKMLVKRMNVVCRPR